MPVSDRFLKRAYIHKDDRAIELLEEAKEHINESLKLVNEAAGMDVDPGAWEALNEDIDALIKDLEE